jgi:hypothetical protein
MKEEEEKERKKKKKRPDSTLFYVYPRCREDDARQVQAALAGVSELSR